MSVLPVISIYATAKAATSTREYGIPFISFQSTLPRRQRLTVPALLVTIFIISIYATAKAATQLVRPGWYIPVISIYATAKAATSIFIMNCKYSKFQSTLPRRQRRPPEVNHKAQTAYFNLRYREGSDITVGLHKDLTIDFNLRYREGSDSKNA